MKSSKLNFRSIFKGLQLAKSLNISHILVIESDSKIAIDLILDDHISSHHPLFPLINNCIYYLQLFQEMKINHIFREANHPADFWLIGDVLQHHPTLSLFPCPLLFLCTVIMTLCLLLIILGLVRLF